MSQSVLSDEVRDFILRKIDSYEQLEVLMLLAGTPSRRWSVDEVAAELRASRMSASQCLEHLARAHVVASEPGKPRQFRYHPQTPNLERAVHHLASCYRELRVSIIHLIFDKPATPGDHDR